MSRLLTRPGLPRKKLLHASERKTPRVQQARASYWQAIAAIDARRLKFVDESGVKLAMTRVYGRAPKGSGSSKARTREALDTAITQSLATVTAFDHRAGSSIAAMAYTHLQTALKGVEVDM